MKLKTVLLFCLGSAVFFNLDVLQKTSEYLPFVQNWMLLGAVWIVYKCQYFLWTDSDKPDNESKYGGPYGSKSSAKENTLKKIDRDFPGREVKIDEVDGSWIITVFDELSEFVFSPIKKSR